MVQARPREPSALREAKKTFTELVDSTYANKHLGLSGQLEVMACECDSHEDEGEEDEQGRPIVCGPESNCINRMTYMECFGEHCGCDPAKCANRRFQKHEHAKIDVFKAGAKGYGVRAGQNIRKGDFIYEYTGEVLDEQRFQKRQQKYDREGVKHFYFMMLQKDEFIDATEKGSLARFCNHSCNPNSAIEKWVVGPKIRMGLFAKRDIAKDEEICFDYKVDRYGSKAQSCYCGEPNCSGFLGGRTQTGGALLPPSVIEGLGLDLESALGWHEKSSQSLRERLLREDLLGSDLESVLRINKAAAKQVAGRSTAKLMANKLADKSMADKSMADKLTENKLMESKLMESKSMESRSMESKSMESKSMESKSTNGSTANRRTESEPTENELMENELMESESMAGRSMENSRSRSSSRTASNKLTSESESESSTPTTPATTPATTPTTTPATATEDLQNDEEDDSSSILPKNEPEGRQRKKKTKPADLLALLDAPSWSLNDLQRQAQQFLIETFPIQDLTPESLPEFMRILMQTQDSGWLINLMLNRVLKTDQPKIQNAIMNMHGYEIMGTVLNRWQNSEDVVISGLAVLQKWPKVTRNKISSSKIESVVADVKSNHADTKAGELAGELLEEWAGLAMGYRIPRRKVSTDPPSQPGEEKSVTEHPEGSPRKANGTSQKGSGNGGDKLMIRNDSRLRDERAAKRLRLPPGWEANTSSDGRTYYVNNELQQTQWTLPPDPRDVEREAKLRKKEQDEERVRLEALQNQREREQEEIQRIINEASNEASVAEKTDVELSEKADTASPTRKNHRFKSSKGTPTNSPVGQSPKDPSMFVQKILASYIPKLVIHREAELGRDRCKRHARDIVHILVSKEIAKHKEISNYELTSDRKNKIKSFVKNYMDKVCSHHEKSQMKSTPS